MLISLVSSPGLAIHAVYLTDSSMIFSVSALGDSECTYFSTGFPLLNKVVHRFFNVHSPVAEKNLAHDSLLYQVFATIFTSFIRIHNIEWSRTHNYRV